MEPTKPIDAITSLPKTATLEEVLHRLEVILPLLENLVDTTYAIEASQEKQTEAIDEVKADTEDLLTQLESISFNVNYPGLGDV